jgi:hypothetical protein
LLAHAVRMLDPVAALDPELGSSLQRLQTMLYEAEDLGAELRRRAWEIEGSPGRLEEVEDRLALLARLERKHGGSIAAVLEHAERCAARRDELAGAEVALEQVQAEIEAAQGELGELAGALTEGRRRAAPLLAEAVRTRLADLAMEGAEFEVALTPRPDGCGPAGAETVELVIAPNPGVPAGPLREIASGGELSRIMLALLSARSRPRASCCASPTCPRSPRWPSGTSASLRRRSAPPPARRSWSSQASRWWPSSCACWVPLRTTAPPASTPAACFAPHKRSSEAPSGGLGTFSNGTRLSSERPHARIPGWL